MTCREVMTPDPVCCLPAETAVRIAKLMKTENIGAIPICDDRHNKKLLGIVTDRDLALKVIGEGRDPKTAKAEDIMTRKPFACRGEDDLQHAGEPGDARKAARRKRGQGIDRARRKVGGATAGFAQIGVHGDVKCSVFTDTLAEVGKSAISRRSTC